ILEVGDHRAAARADDHAHGGGAEARRAAGDEEDAVAQLHYFGAGARITDIAVAIIPATSAALVGRIIVFALIARLPNAATYCSATLKLTACSPPGDSIASATCRIAFAFASAIARIAAAW